MIQKMHPIQSMIAHLQSFVMNHFGLTHYAIKLKKLKNIHSGEACFVIGNGPSLTPDDLSAIEKAKIPSFAFNRIYLMFDKTTWRPTYYISQDERILKNCTAEVSGMHLKNKFIPLNLKYYFGIHIDGATYFKMINGPINGYYFSDDISRCAVNSNTVTCTAIQFAAYMGFKTIYLIGVDHNFSVYKNAKGEIIEDKTVRDYFSDEYNKDKTQLYIPNLDESTVSYLRVKQYCDKHGIRVFNCTRGGKLEIYHRIMFEKTIQKESRMRNI